MHSVGAVDLPFGEKEIKEENKGRKKKRKKNRKKRKKLELWLTFIIN